jgi:hypothetical protein
MAHIPYQELAKRVQGAEVKVKPGSLWHHWRDPEQRYRVIRVGLDEATETLVVVYEMLVEPQPVVWVRPLRGPTGWLTPVSHKGAEVARFQPVAS